MGKRKTFSILGSTRVVKMLLISLFVFAPFQWVGAQVTLNKGNTTLGAVINQIQKQTKDKGRCSLCKECFCSERTQLSAEEPRHHLYDRGQCRLSEERCQEKCQGRSSNNSPAG